MEKLNLVALLLVIIGAINWGLVGVIDLDLVEFLTNYLAYGNVIARIVYVLVGLSGLYSISLLGEV